MNPNPAAASNNLHHTQPYRSYDDFLESFRCDPPYGERVATHNYPLDSVSDILVGNEPTDWGKPVPF